MCDVEVPIERLGVHEQDAPVLLGFLREMEFATLTKRIAEGLGAEVPPPTGPKARAETHASVPDGSATRTPDKAKGAAPARTPRRLPSPRSAPS